MSDSRFLTLSSGRVVTRLRCWYCGALDAEYRGDLDADGQDVAVCGDGVECANRDDDEGDDDGR